MLHRIPLELRKLKWHYWDLAVRHILLLDFAIISSVKAAEMVVGLNLSKPCGQQHTNSCSSMTVIGTNAC